MSCDFFVWHPQQQISNAEATKLYLRLCDGDTSALEPHSSIDAFYAELTARHPEIDTIPEEKIDDRDYLSLELQTGLFTKLRHHVLRLVQSKLRP